MRLLALTVVATICLALGLGGHHWFDPGVAVDCTGYWIVAALVLLWLGTAMAWIRSYGMSCWALVGPRGVLWVSCAWAFLVTREPSEFKVVMDEPMLVGASLGMHAKRTSAMPLRAYEVAGVREYSGGFLDKRPLLYPFLLSCVHDLTGYRVENTFHLNKAVLFVLLLVGWVVARRLDPAIGGGLFLVWLCGWPLVAQNACGGGFELLNLGLILLVALAALQYLEDRNRVTEAFLLLGCLLLANTRYESVLYLLAFAGLWLIGGWREREWSAGWLAVVSPVFLLPYLWQRAAVAQQGGYWGLEVKSAVHPFGAEYLLPNLRHAWRFFTHPDPELAGSPFFAGLGIFAIIALVGIVVAAWRTRDAVTGRPLWALCAVAGPALAGFGVLMVYFWGHLDDPIVSRLALPVIGVMGLSVVAVRHRWLPSPRSCRLLLAALALWFVAYTLPVMNQHRYSQNNIHMRIFRWTQEIVRQSAAHNPLVIGSQERLWIAYRVPALSPEVAVARLPQIEFHRSSGTFDAIFVVQSLFDDPKTRARVPLAGNAMPLGVTLVPVAECSFYPFNVVRISRVTAIDLDQVEHSPLPQSTSCEVYRDATPAEMKAWRDLLP